MLNLELEANVATGKPSDDLKRTFQYMLEASYGQFVTPSNLLYAGAAAPALWYSFDQDDRLSQLARSKRIPGHIQATGDLGVVFNMPLTPIGLYYIGRSMENSHLMQFMMEYSATLYLALGESALMSLIPIHERPDTSRSDFWETAFRGKSSFPSGHMLPYAALTFKTFQFYGPWWTLPPLVLTVWASQQRVLDGKHYVSDVVGSFFLAAFASEGVRRSAGYQGNHPVYRWIFERSWALGVTRYQGIPGIQMATSF